MRRKSIDQKNSFILYLSFLILLLVPYWAQAQLLAPNQPEQDACEAIQLCGKTFTSTYSYQGVGIKLDLRNTPCGSGEANSVWLKVTIATAGKLMFAIRPIDILDDYDFAVVQNNGDCANLTFQQVVRCNFNNNLKNSNINGVVGLSDTSHTPFVQSGTTGYSFAQSIDAAPGDVYYIMVNNFGYDDRPSSGFTIDFSTSTATFANTTIPLLNNLVTSCDNSQSATIHLSNYALCGSIATDGSDFVLMSADRSKTFPILLASGVNCSSTTGYARDVFIQFQSRLPNGDYIIQAKKGTDGNSILGLCGGETLDDAPPVSFSILFDSLKLTSLDSPACQKMQLVFSQTLSCNSIRNDGSQFYITGPSATNIISAQPLLACQNETTSGILLTLDKPIYVDGQYILHSVEDTSLFGSCTSKLYNDINQPFNVHSFNGLVKTLGDTTVCGWNDSIQLISVNSSTPPSGGFQYKWTVNSNSTTNTNQLSPWVRILENKNHFQVETIDQKGCVLRDTVNIQIETFKGSLTPTNVVLCLNDSLQLKASDNAIAYQWFQDPTLRMLSVSTFSSTDIPNPIYRPDQVGTFDYYLLMRSRKQCLDTLTTHIQVKPLPVLELAFHDTTINYGMSVRLLTNGDGVKLSWSPTISLLNSMLANPIAHPLVNTTYTVYSYGANSCKVFDTVRVLIYFQDYAYFPSAFTPNNDGKNDMFRARFFGKIDKFQLNIFTRWGQKIYSSNNPDVGWDGKTNGSDAPSGTYVWECTYQPNGHNQYYKKGTVVLIR